MNYKELTTDFGNGSKIKNGKFLDNLDPGFPTKPNLNGKLKPPHIISIRPNSGILMRF